MWNHPTETTNKKMLFRVPGRYKRHLQTSFKIDMCHVVISGDEGFRSWRGVHPCMKQVRCWFATDSPFRMSKTPWTTIHVELSHLNSKCTKHNKHPSGWKVKGLVSSWLQYTMLQWSWLCDLHLPPFSTKVLTKKRCLQIFKKDLEAAKSLRQKKPTVLDGHHASPTWQFFVTFLGWLSDPYRWLSDLQLGDEKVTLNHLV